MICGILFNVLFKKNRKGCSCGCVCSVFGFYTDMHGCLGHACSFMYNYCRLYEILFLSFFLFSLIPFLHRLCRFEPWECWDLGSSHCLLLLMLVWFQKKRANQRRRDWGLLYLETLTRWVIFLFTCEIFHCYLKSCILL